MAEEKTEDLPPGLGSGAIPGKRALSLLLFNTNGPVHFSSRWKIVQEANLFSVQIKERSESRCKASGGGDCGMVRAGANLKVGALVLTPLFE